MSISQILNDITSINLAAQPLHGYGLYIPDEKPRKPKSHNLKLLEKYHDGVVLTNRVSKDQFCETCYMIDICGKRAKLKLPVACEYIYDIDQIFLERYTDELLASLKVIESK